ncbi:hypothetical protein ASG79_17260 [Arthrobacter sp. Soil761]|nr:hypothetical protein ASG79_17260 [Arthrobacter sp. Soil761]
MFLDLQGGGDVGGCVLHGSFEDAAAGGLSGSSVHSEETEQGVLECSPANIGAASLMAFQYSVSGHLRKDAPQSSH